MASGFNSIVLVAAFLECYVSLGVAQVTVNVSYIPPSPVPIGTNVTFVCDFSLPSEAVLVQLFWELQNGDRIFEYFPGSSPVIPPDYEDKISGYSTDDTSYLNMFFTMSACDVGQYQCYVLASNNEDNDDQELLMVQDNDKSPYLTVNDLGVVGPVILVPLSRALVTCELFDAGPPEPVSLELLTEFGDVPSGPSTRDPDTCTWNFFEPPSIEVWSNITRAYSFGCVVTYAGGSRKTSRILTLTPDVRNTGASQHQPPPSKAVKKMSPQKRKKHHGGKHN